MFLRQVKTNRPEKASWIFREPRPTKVEPRLTIRPAGRQTTTAQTRATTSENWLYEQRAEVFAPPIYGPAVPPPRF